MELTVKSDLPFWEIPEYGHVGETRWARLLQNLGKARQLAVTLSKAVVTVVEGASAILSKWFLLSRLETRTKESNTYASVLVEKPTRGMKVSDAKRKQQHQPTMIISERFE